MASLKWNGAEAERRVRAGVVANLRAACLAVARHARQLLSTPGTGGTSKKRVYGANPSAPGEPPHKQRGRLWGSVATEVDPPSLTGRVGTNVRYGRWLELGTSKMAARPWLRRALAEMTPTVMRLLSRRPPGL